MSLKEVSQRLKKKDPDLPRGISRRIKRNDNKRVIQYVIKFEFRVPIDESLMVSKQCESLDQALALHSGYEHVKQLDAVKALGPDKKRQTLSVFLDEYKAFLTEDWLQQHLNCEQIRKLARANTIVLLQHQSTKPACKADKLPSVELPRIELCDQTLLGNSGENDIRSIAEQLLYIQVLLQPAANEEFKNLFASDGNRNKEQPPPIIISISEVEAPGSGASAAVAVSSQSDGLCKPERIGMFTEQAILRVLQGAGGYELLNLHKNAASIAAVIGSANGKQQSVEFVRPSGAVSPNSGRHEIACAKPEEIAREGEVDVEVSVEPSSASDNYRSLPESASAQDTSNSSRAQPSASPVQERPCGTPAAESEVSGETVSDDGLGATRLSTEPNTVDSVPAQPNVPAGQDLLCLWQPGLLKSVENTIASLPGSGPMERANSKELSLSRKRSISGHETGLRLPTSGPAGTSSASESSARPEKRRMVAVSKSQDLPKGIQYRAVDGTYLVRKAVRGTQSVCSRMYRTPLLALAVNYAVDNWFDHYSVRQLPPSGAICRLKSYMDAVASRLTLIQTHILFDTHKCALDRRLAFQSAGELLFRKLTEGIPGTVPIDPHEFTPQQQLESTQLLESLTRAQVPPQHPSTHQSQNLTTSHEGPEQAQQNNHATVPISDHPLPDVNQREAQSVAGLPSCSSFEFPPLVSRLLEHSIADWRCMTPSSKQHMDPSLAVPQQTQAGVAGAASVPNATATATDDTVMPPSVLPTPTPPNQTCTHPSGSSCTRIHATLPAPSPCRPPLQSQPQLSAPTASAMAASTAGRAPACIPSLPDRSPIPPAQTCPTPRAAANTVVSNAIDLSQVRRTAPPEAVSGLNHCAHHSYGSPSRPSGDSGSVHLEIQKSRDGDSRSSVGMAMDRCVTAVVVKQPAGGLGAGQGGDGSSGEARQYEAGLAVPAASNALQQNSMLALFANHLSSKAQDMGGATAMTDMKPQSSSPGNSPQPVATPGASKVVHQQPTTQQASSPSQATASSPGSTATPPIPCMRIILSSSGEVTSSFTVECKSDQADVSFECEEVDRAWFLAFGLNAMNFQLSRVSNHEAQGMPLDSSATLQLFGFTLLAQADLLRVNLKAILDAGTMMRENMQKRTKVVEFLKAFESHGTLIVPCTELHLQEGKRLPHLYEIIHNLQTSFLCSFQFAM